MIEQSTQATRFFDHIKDWVTNGKPYEDVAELKNEFDSLREKDRAFLTNDEDSELSSFDIKKLKNFQKSPAVPN